MPLYAEAIAALNRLDDVLGGDAVAVEEFLGLAAVGNFADGNPVDVNAGLGDRFRDGVTNAAGGVVILDRDDLPAGRLAGGMSAPAASTGRH